VRDFTGKLALRTFVNVIPEKKAVKAKK